MSKKVFTDKVNQKEDLIISFTISIKTFTKSFNDIFAIINFTTNLQKKIKVFEKVSNNLGYFNKNHSLSVLFYIKCIIFEFI